MTGTDPDPTLEWETRYHQAHWDVAQNWAELDRTNPFNFRTLDGLLTNTSNDLLDAGVPAKDIRRALVRAFFQSDLHPRLPRFWFRR